MFHFSSPNLNNFDHKVDLILRRNVFIEKTFKKLINCLKYIPKRTDSR